MIVLPPACRMPSTVEDWYVNVPLPASGGAAFAPPAATDAPASAAARSARTVSFLMVVLLSIDGSPRSSTPPVPARYRTGAVRPSRLGQGCHDHVAATGRSWSL